MPINIRVHLAEKRSTTSQYENQTIGADIEASGLELHSAADIQAKIRELFSSQEVPFRRSSSSRCRRSARTVTRATVTTDCQRTGMETVVVPMVGQVPNRLRARSNSSASSRTSAI